MRYRSYGLDTKKPFGCISKEHPNFIASIEKLTNYLKRLEGSYPTGDEYDNSPRRGPTLVRRRRRPTPRLLPDETLERSFQRLSHRMQARVTLPRPTPSAVG